MKRTSVLDRGLKKWQGTQHRGELTTVTRWPKMSNDSTLIRVYFCLWHWSKQVLFIHNYSTRQFRDLGASHLVSAELWTLLLPRNRPAAEWDGWAGGAPGSSKVGPEVSISLLSLSHWLDLTIITYFSFSRFISLNRGQITAILLHIEVMSLFRTRPIHVLFKFIKSFLLPSVLSFSPNHHCVVGYCYIVHPFTFLLEFPCL